MSSRTIKAYHSVITGNRFYEQNLDDGETKLSKQNDVRVIGSYDPFTEQKDESSGDYLHFMWMLGNEINHQHFRDMMNWMQMVSFPLVKLPEIVNINYTTERTIGGNGKEDYVVYDTVARYLVCFEFDESFAPLYRLMWG